MTDELMFHHGTTMVRRLRLAPGEAMPWHRDPFYRIAVVLVGDVLSISPGQVDWEEPTERIHRAVNVGKQHYEQVTVFLLDSPDAVAQPTEEWMGVQTAPSFRSRLLFGGQRRIVNMNQAPPVLALAINLGFQAVK
jgi:hypothetical protein